jgi:hypothetical protein
VVWIPGKGPVPVDPDWLPTATQVSPAKRDLIAALAMTEIVDKISDPAMRARLNDAAVSAMHQAADRIGAGA